MVGINADILQLRTKACSIKKFHFDLYKLNQLLIQKLYNSYLYLYKVEDLNGRMKYIFSILVALGVSQWHGRRSHN